MKPTITSAQDNDMEAHSLKGTGPMCCYTKNLGTISNILQTKT